MFDQGNNDTIIPNFNINTFFSETIINDPNTINNITLNSNAIRNISILSHNVNSMNMSTRNSYNKNVNSFHRKLNQILKNNCDIYMLQDLRLVKPKYHNMIEKDLSCNKFGNFDFIGHSSKNKRGCAFIFRKDLNYKILRKYTSICENAIILDILINNFRMTLGCLYGPYESNDRYFFKK